MKSKKAPRLPALFEKITILDHRGEQSRQYLMVQDSMIVYRGPKKPTARDVGAQTLAKAVKIESSNTLVTPGFWNGHGHLGLSYLRSMGHGYQHVIDELFFKTEKFLSEKTVEALCAADIRTGLLSGTVAFVDHYYFHRGTARALDAAGLRGFVAETFLDLGGPFPGHESFEEFKKSIAKWKYSERIVPVAGPHASDTVSELYFKQIVAHARSQGMKIHFHLSQRESEFEKARRETGQTPVELLDSWGVLGPDCLAVHLIHLTENDFKILKRTGTHVAFCPSSQIIFNKLAPIEKFLEYEIPFLIGTDDAASNDLADMHMETKIACLMARARGAHTEAIAQKFFKAATATGPQFFGLRSGEIDSGMKADLAFYELGIETEPRKNPFESFVFSMSSRFLKALMIDGLWRVWDRNILNPQAPQLEKRYLKALKELHEKAQVSKTPS